MKRNNSHEELIQEKFSLGWSKIRKKFLKEFKEICWWNEMNSRNIPNSLTIVQMGCNKSHPNPRTLPWRKVQTFGMAHTSMKDPFQKSRLVFKVGARIKMPSSFPSVEKKADTMEIWRFDELFPVFLPSFHPVNFLGFSSRCWSDPTPQLALSSNTDGHQETLWILQCSMLVVQPRGCSTLGLWLFNHRRQAGGPEGGADSGVVGLPTSHLVATQKGSQEEQVPILISLVISMCYTWICFHCDWTISFFQRNKLVPCETFFFLS